MCELTAARFAPCDPVWPSSLSDSVALTSCSCLCECGGCFPKVSLPLLRRFPVCAVFLRSEYYQRIRLPLQRLPFSGMFHSSSILCSFPLRAETTVDLSGSSRLPFPNVPSSLPPPQSPVTIASCGDLLLPSSQYDAVGLRVTIITRLNRFTCVTARLSLVPTLNSCRCLHEPKARFPVGRLVPLSGAGISPAGSISLFLTHHICDAVRRGLGGKEYTLPSQQYAIGASRYSR